MDTSPPPPSPGVEVGDVVLGPCHLVLGSGQSPCAPHLCLFLVVLA